MHGTSDTATIMNHFANLAWELESTGVAHELITCRGGQHAFTVFLKESDTMKGLAKTPGNGLRISLQIHLKNDMNKGTAGQKGCLKNRKEVKANV